MHSKPRLVRSPADVEKVGVSVGGGCGGEPPQPKRGACVCACAAVAPIVSATAVRHPSKVLVIVVSPESCRAFGAAWPIYLNVYYLKIQLFPVEALAVAAFCPVCRGARRGDQGKRDEWRGRFSASSAAPASTTCRGSRTCASSASKAP